MPLTENVYSHGLCPDCCAQSRSHFPQILRDMIQANLDQAGKLIAIGDPSMALAELRQALTKFDQLFNSLES